MNEKALLEERVGAALRARQLTLATAESCTGGLIGHRLTNVPGSSDYYLGGFVAYSYSAKELLLGVPHEMLARYGAVSEQVALAMAHGARHALGADMAIAVTGIAGPGGGLPNKPVGLVWLALVTAREAWARHHLWTSDREGNKALSATAALQWVLDYVTAGAV